MPRLQWDDLPDLVRDEVGRIAGAHVVEAVSQPGGYSPGTADRLLLSDGRRVFAKAVSTSQNPDSPGLHRREIAVTAALPEAAPAPRLLGSFDDGTWVVLVLEDVEGRHPHEPWSASDLRACLDALDRLADTCTPCPLPELPDVVDELRDLFAGWDNIARDPTGVDAVVLHHLDELVTLATGSAERCAGDTLVHVDLRADNLLVRPDGSVVIVDWPWASRGSDWYDALMVLANAEMTGSELDVDGLTRTWPRLARVSASDVDAVLAGAAGYFFDMARRPAPTGLPTVRQFQLREGQAVLAWLGRRRGW